VTVSKKEKRRRVISMLTKEEEIGCFEILKNNFPELNKQGLVIGVNEFLAAEKNLFDYICRHQTPKEAALDYISEKIPYIVLDETEGYKCIFFRGNHIKAHYDVTNSKLLGYAEETI
jgi:hypothetical protein